MSNVDVVVDENSLRIASSGAITGTLYLQVQGRAFPEHSWTDFPVVVLSWWLSSLQRLTSGTSSAEDLLFMDGPFVVRVVRHGAQCEIEMIDRHSNAPPPERFTASVAELRGAIKGAAEKILKACHSQNIVSEDLRTLEAGIKDLTTGRPIRLRWWQLWLVPAIPSMLLPLLALAMDHRSGFFEIAHRVAVLSTGPGGILAMRWESSSDWLYATIMAVSAPVWWLTVGIAFDALRGRAHARAFLLLVAFGTSVVCAIGHLALLAGRHS